MGYTVTVTPYTKKGLGNEPSVAFGLTLQDIPLGAPLVRWGTELLRVFLW
jgi:hypothetical protein